MSHCETTQVQLHDSATANVTVMQEGNQGSKRKHEQGDHTTDDPETPPVTKRCRRPYQKENQEEEQHPSTCTGPSDGTTACSFDHPLKETKDPICEPHRMEPKTIEPRDRETRNSLCFLSADDLKRIWALTYLERYQRAKVPLFQSRPPIALGVPREAITARPTRAVDLSVHRRYQGLEEQDILHHEIHGAALVDVQNEAEKVQKEVQKELHILYPLAQRFKRQHSEWWFRNRKRRPTGSKQANAAGIFGFKSLLRCWLETYDPKNPILAKLDQEQDASCPDEVAARKEKMAWGSDHEIDAVATLVDQMGEAFDLMLCEVTLTAVELDVVLIKMVRDTLAKIRPDLVWDEEREAEWQDAFRSSPDGNIRMVLEEERAEDEHDDEEEGEIRDASGPRSPLPAGMDRTIRARQSLRAKLEIKCPYGERQPIQWDAPKYYYYGQVQLHLLTDPSCAFCLFGCWTPESTRVWKIKRDPIYWQLALPLLVHFHQCGIEGQAPTEEWYKTEEANCRKLLDHCKKVVYDAEFIGEFPSVYSLHRGDELPALFAQRFGQELAHLPPMAV